MGKTKRKKTTLSINFIDSDNSISDDENMSKLMELLGAPDFRSKSEIHGWDITAPNGKSVHVSSSEIRDFIADTMFNAKIDMVMHEEYYFNTYANRIFIEGAFFDATDDSNPHSELGTLWSGSITIETIGNNVTKTALDRLHKKNVLSLKDKIVSMKHVQNVEYTCILKDVNEVECSV